MSDVTTNEATALMAAGMYASPPTEEKFKAGIERAESWIAAHDAQVRAEALRDAAVDLPAETEGTDRARTARWPAKDRDVYSTAIEDAQDALIIRADRIEQEGAGQ